jgi:hypothetical protein
MLGMPPQGIHDWAQADRLALAIGFYDNGMNFFLPTTYNQYSVNGITGVEFPLPAYLAALGGKLLGRDSISIAFRFIDTLVACISLIFLYLACYKRTKDFAFSMFTPLFLFCSPIFIYYTCSYIPDATAVAIIFIAFYFMLQYLDHYTTKPLLIGLALLTLATLIKTSTGIYLIAYGGYILLQRAGSYRHHKKSQNVIILIAIASAFSIPVGYYFYNQYLNHTYHSTVFLAKANPFVSYKAFQEYIDVNFKKLWMREYMELPQYLVLAVVIAVGLPLLKSVRAGSSHLWLLLLFLLGTLCMGYFMGGQLFFHDYYVLSIFMPLLTYALLVCSIAIHHSIAQYKVASIRRGLITAVLIMFFFADYHHYQRLQPNYFPFNPGIPWAKGGSDLLDKLQIPRSERIFAYNASAPNLALLYCDRKGYHLPDDQSDPLRAISLMQRLKVKTMVCPVGAANYILHDNKDVAGRFQLLGSRDNIAVLRLL